MYLRLLAVVIAGSAFLGLFGFVNNHYSVTTPQIVGGVGNLDETFGQSGKTTALFFGKSAFAYAAALQADGRIIAAGGNSTTQGFSLARFNTDGTLDNSFGQIGRVVTAFNDFAFAQAVALQTDRKIVAAGVANDSSGTRELQRYVRHSSRPPTTLGRAYPKYGCGRRRRVNQNQRWTLSHANKASSLTVNNPSLRYPRMAKLVAGTR